MSTTSTSDSAATGSTPEDVLRPSTAVDPGDMSEPSGSDVTQSLAFSSGNPGILETRGVMILYRDDIFSSTSQLPVDRKPYLCVLAVPNHLKPQNFCQFCDSFIQHILEMRLVRNDGMGDQYSVLIRLDNQNSADDFYKHFNGRRFSSQEEEVCRVLFIVDVQYAALIEHAQFSSASSMEEPYCPVCLGLMASCWETQHDHYISSQVCRYCQQQPEKSNCSVCGTSENLWICVICGFVGCGRYKEGHAIRHWKETQHRYSVGLETQYFWDNDGDN